MLQEIAKIVRLPWNPSNTVTNSFLRRIERHLPIKCNPSLSDKQFVSDVKRCLLKVMLEDEVEAFNIEHGIKEPEHVSHRQRIKCSPKGVRSANPAKNGIRYAYGPIWNDSVLKGKGIALSNQNREKLNHQGEMFGIEDPENFDVLLLVSEIAARLESNHA